MATGSWASVYADVEVTDDGKRITRLHEGLGTTEESLKQCRAANRILGSLKDPRIVGAESVELTDGRLTLKTAAVKGRPVGELLADGLTVAKAVHILEQTCEAIDAAQGLGVVHGALTPGSVLVGEGDEPEVWVTHFGLAHVFAGGATGKGPAQWHPLRPESMLGAPTTPATDVYLLGNFAVALLAGRPTFEGDDAADLRRMHAIEDTQVFEHMPEGKNVPETLSRIIQRCLLKEPEERFAAAADLGRMLRKHREDQWSVIEDDPSQPIELDLPPSAPPKPEPRASSAPANKSVADLRAKLGSAKAPPPPPPSARPTLPPDESVSAAGAKAAAPSGTPTLERKISSVKMELLLDGGSTEAAMEVGKVAKGDAQPDNDEQPDDDEPLEPEAEPEPEPEPANDEALQPEPESDEDEDAEPEPASETDRAPEPESASDEDDEDEPPEPESDRDESDDRPVVAAKPATEPESKNRWLLPAVAAVAAVAVGGFLFARSDKTPAPEPTKTTAATAKPVTSVPPVEPTQDDADANEDAVGEDDPAAHVLDVPAVETDGGGAEGSAEDDAVPDLGGGAEAEPDPEPEPEPEAEPEPTSAATKPKGTKPKGPRPKVLAKELTQQAAAANRAGDAAGAIKLYEQALAAKRRYAPAAFGLSGIYFNQAKYDQAAKYGAIAAKAAPRNATYHLRLGDIYFKMGKKDDAARYWENAADLGNATAQKRLEK